MVDASIQNAKQDKHKVETNLLTELIDSTQNKIEEKGVVGLPDKIQGG